jgi:predicted nucleotidyltransferase
MKQQLRSHPALRYCGLSSWPPAWSGAYDPGAALPIGEQGRLENINFVSEVPGLDSPALELSINFKERTYSGLLLVDDTGLLPKLEELLRRHLGQPLERIGALEAELPVRSSQRTHVQQEFLTQDNTLAEVVRRLAHAYQPLAIYLFGSRARGDHRSGSDYDLLIVVPDDAPTELQTSARAYKCLPRVGKGVDVLVCTDNYFRTRWRVRTSMPARVRRDGKVLYAA